MKEFQGKALRWQWRDGVVEVTLDHEPLNEIGTTMLADLEKFAGAIRGLAATTSACIFTSARAGGFCAGADLKELYHSALKLSKAKRAAGVRVFLQRIHRVMNAIDEARLRRYTDCAWAADWNWRWCAIRLWQTRWRALAFRSCG